MEEVNNPFKAQYSRFEKCSVVNSAGRIRIYSMLSISETPLQVQSVFLSFVWLHSIKPYSAKCFNVPKENLQMIRLLVH